MAPSATAPNAVAQGAAEDEGALEEATALEDEAGALEDAVAEDASAGAELESTVADEDPADALALCRDEPTPEEAKEVAGEDEAPPDPAEEPAALEDAWPPPLLPDADAASSRHRPSEHS